MRARVARLLGRRPLFSAALGAAACIALADSHPLAGLALVLLLGLCAGLALRWPFALCWLLCGGLATGHFLRDRQQRAAAEQRLLASPLPRQQTGTVLADPLDYGAQWVAQVRLSAGPERGTCVLWKGRGALPVAGSLVRARGEFQPLPVPRNPGEFDRAAWLRRQGIAAVLDASRHDGAVATGRMAGRGAAIRASFREAITAGLPPASQAASVIRAVVIGEYPPDQDAVVTAFRHSGTYHIFSVSGMHVALVGSFGWLVLRFLGMPRRVSVILLIPMVFSYSWITGNSPPAVRASWMMSLFLLAFVFRRKPDLLNTLGAVLLGALLWDGNLLFQAGAQLSYGVVAAIALGTAWASRGFLWLTRREEYLPVEAMSRWQRGRFRFRKRAAQILGASTAATIGSTPLTGIHFGMITPISILATPALGPPVFLLLSASLVSASFHPWLPPVSRSINRGNAWIADGCVLMARAFSAIPASHLYFPRSSQPQLLLYDLEYGAAAAVFSQGRRGAVFIDCGDRFSFEQRVAPSLQTLGLRPDSVLLSHPDSGHLGSPAVWERFPVRQALLPVSHARSPAYQAWLRDAPRHGVRLGLAARGQHLPFPAGATMETLYTPEPDTRHASADDRVVLYRLHWNGWKLLFTTDAGIATERRLLASGADPSADVIIAGRHHRDLTLSDALLDAVAPQAIIAAHSDHPPAKRLPAGQVNYWTSRNIHVLDQRQTGGVTLRVQQDGSLLLEGYADRSLLRLPPR